jgi:tRNA modification GTPase
LARLRETFAFGKIVSAGLTIAIIGRPNVGKSSVFNALLREERAIVTEIPGTTRDLIAETTQIEGIPVRLLDTAGIREAVDRVERLGIDRSVEALADADRILFVVDGSEALQDEDLQILQRLRGRRYFLVVNKIDLIQRVDVASIEDLLQTVCRVSAKGGQGIEALRQALFEEYGRDRLLESEDSLITNVRHERLIRDALEAVERSQNSHCQQMPHEVLLLDLYAALKSLNALTGETTVEDILENIFSTFCIGK